MFLSLCLILMGTLFSEGDSLIWGCFAYHRNIKDSFFLFEYLYLFFIYVFKLLWYFLLKNYFSLTFLFSPKDMLGGGGAEKKKCHCERETFIGCLLYASQPRIEPWTFWYVRQRSHQCSSHLARASRFWFDKYRNL